MRELRRIVSFPSESELTYKAKILFEEVITFARKKSHKSQQLICILQKVQDNDVHELTLSKYKRLRLGPCMYITYILMYTLINISSSETYRV